MYYILIIILCVCVEGWGWGGGLKKKQKCTLQVYQTWVHSPTHVKIKEHPRRNGNFRDSIIFRKHCVWLEFAWCTRYDICHIQTAQSNLLHYYLSCFPFQIVRFYKHGCWHLATTHRDLCSGFPIFPSWILAYQ